MKEFEYTDLAIAFGVALYFFADSAIGGKFNGIMFVNMFWISYAFLLRRRIDHLKDAQQNT